MRRAGRAEMRWRGSAPADAATFDGAAARRRRGRLHHQVGHRIGRLRFDPALGSGLGSALLVSAGLVSTGLTLDRLRRFRRRPARPCARRLRPVADAATDWRPRRPVPAAASVTTEPPNIGDGWRPACRNSALIRIAMMARGRQHARDQVLRTVQQHAQHEAALLLDRDGRCLGAAATARRLSSSSKSV